VTGNPSRQLDAFTTPGSLLRAAREKQGMTPREAADRLNFMPNYVSILERDDYRALRSPSFARGYIRSYGRLLGVDEAYLLSLFDAMREEVATTPAAPPKSRPLQLQHTGMGVVIGVGVLMLLVAALWWWGGPAAGPGAGLEAAVGQRDGVLAVGEGG